MEQYASLLLAYSVSSSWSIECSLTLNALLSSLSSYEEDVSLWFLFRESFLTGLGGQIGEIGEILGKVKTL